MVVLMTGHSQMDVYMGYRMCLIDVDISIPSSSNPARNYSSHRYRPVAQIGFCRLSNEQHFTRAHRSNLL
jgi:hypothetical protein